MLPNEPAIIAGRQGFPDAQAAFTGASTPVGSFSVSWYGTNTSDELGSFGLVNPLGALASYVGEFLRVVYKGECVNVYIIGSLTTLTTELGLTRRMFLALTSLANDPIMADVRVLL